MPLKSCQGLDVRLAFVTMDIEKIVSKAGTLVEALPYLQAFRGKTFLIKMGGSAMEDENLVRNIMQDVVFLEVAGINPVIVHGGGKAISKAMEEAGIEARFINGLRVTSDQAIELVANTLSNQINPRLVDFIQSFEGQAKGIPGNEVFMAQKIQATKAGEDVGRVGEVTSCELTQVTQLIKNEVVPVISPLGREIDSDQLLNVNADLAAAALAKELKVSKLIYLSDVPGVMRDFHNPKSIISTIDPALAKQLINDGIIAGGMLPKVNSALDALNHGVSKVHFIDGRLPHSLLLEIFTRTGVGTEIIAQ